MAVRKRKKRKRPKRSRKSRTKGPASVPARKSTNDPPPASLKEWLAGLAFATLGITILSFVQIGMNGPEFLMLYAGACVFAAVVVCVAVKSKGGLATSIVVALLFFEGVGVIRWIYGTSHGMSQFDKMFAWMFLGGVGIIFVGIISAVEWDYSSSSSRSSSGGFWGSCGSNCGSSCSSSSGSSCGGGCGGCGGE